MKASLKKSAPMTEWILIPPDDFTHIHRKSVHIFARAREVDDGTIQIVQGVISTIMNAAGLVRHRRPLGCGYRACLHYLFPVRCFTACR